MNTSYGQITLSKVNDGESVTVSKTEYQAGTSNTTAPTGTWSTSPVSVAEGSFLWTKVTYSDGKVAYSVAKQGKSGSSVEVTKTEYAYQLSTSGTAVPTGTWKTTPQAPTTTQFAWTRTTTTFSDGKTAVTYTVGGKTGTSVTVSSQSVTYQAGTSGTTKPTGTWQSSVPSVSEGQYLWTKTVVNYSDGKSTEAYSVSRNAVNGESPTVSSTVVEYQQSTNGTTPPTGTWQSSAPSAKAGQYMWTRTTVTYSDNATAISYTVSRNGSDGTSPTAYNLIVSHAAVAKSQNGEYNPSSIILSSKSQTGSDAWDDYAGRFTIDTTEDNTTWTNRYTSKANENTKTYEISPDGWAVADSEPYLLRKSAGNGDIKSMAIQNIITGGTVIWNQLIKDEWITNSTTSYGLTITNNGDGSVTINGTVTDKSATGTPIYAYISGSHGTSFFHCTKDHKYLYLAPKLPDGVSGYNVLSGSTAAMGYKLKNGSAIFNCLQTADTYAFGRFESIQNGATFNNYRYYLCVFDLTLMFGPTIADYIYAQEQAAAGAGVALAKAWAGINGYEPYDAGTPRSVSNLSAHKIVGKNLVDPSTEVSGYINGTNGTIAGASSTQLERASDYIQIPIGTSKVYFGFEHSVSGQKWIGIGFYTSDKTFISRTAVTGNTSYNVTVPSGTCYVRVSARTWGESGEYLFLNLEDATYEPYKAISYPLDSRLTLRGILKLDGNNKLYYDGDEYPPSGEVKRRYHLGNLGTLNWTYVEQYETMVSEPIAGRKLMTEVRCAKYTYTDMWISTSTWASSDKVINSTSTGDTRIRIKDTAYTDATAFKTAMSGVLLLYELETPTTETATPYTTSQVSYADGTEEYITDGIPVGHVTKYSPDITGIRCSLYFENGTTTLLDQQTVPIVSDGINGDNGKDAYTVLLTNESHTFAGGKTAAVDGQTATIGVVGYRGAVQRATTVGTITGAPTGMTATISNNSTTSTTVTVSVTSSMTTKNGTLTIPVTVDGTVFNLIFSYAIAFTGASGVGTSGLGWKVNATGLATTNNGECYFYGYNDQNQEVAGNGWVMWNGVKLTIEGGTWINPDEVAPYNTSILHVYRTSGSTPALRHCDVWWDSTTGKWMGYNYSGNNTTPAGKAEWVWNEATDCILATYVEPSSEGKIVSAQLFNPPKKYSELPDPKIGFDLEDLTETVEELQPELIVGTHGTTATATWTGTSTKLKTISAGTRIQYKLSSAGASNVTLNLTLADGTKTGAKNVFYSNTTRLGTQYGINAIIDLVYDGSAWRILNPYTNSNTVGVYGGTFKTGANGAKKLSLLMKDTEGTWTSFTTTEGTGTSKPKYTGGFLLSDLMYFSGSTTQSAGIVTGTGYKALALDFRYSSNCGSTLVSGQEVYIVGEMNSDDHMFHLDDTWWTQTEPTTDDGKTYIYVGIAYNTTSVYLSVSNPAMRYYDGQFLTFDEIEKKEAQASADEAQEMVADVAEATNDKFDDIQEDYNGKIDSLVKDLGSLQTSLTDGVGKANKDLQDLSESVDTFAGTYATKFEQLDKYIRFLVDEGNGTFNGIELGPLNGNEEERLQLRVGTYTDDNGNQLTCISFARGGENIGYFDGNDLYTGNIKVEVSQRAQFGNFAFVPRNGGALSFLKVV